MAAALLVVGALTTACTRGDPQPEVTTQPEVSTARYAHLGDSFAAGSGIDPTVPDSPAMCLRSQLNFGQLIARGLHDGTIAARSRLRGLGAAEFADVSCGAATTADLTVAQYFGVAPQADVLGPSTELVTLLIGGNDGRLFADAVKACSAVAETDVDGDPCRRSSGARFDDEVATTIAPALVDAVALVKRRAPNARLLVVGYPRILPARGGCYPVMRIAAGDVAYLDDLQVRLNRAIAAAATTGGATYVDTWSASAGRDACAPPDRRWVEPMVGARTRTTVHPNAAGQRGIADAVAAALR